MSIEDGWIEAGVNDGGAAARRSMRQGANITYVNEAGLSDPLFRRTQAAINQEVANEIEKWSQSLSLSGGETTWGYDWFNRTKWNQQRHQFAIMGKCAWAVENDDVLSTLVDVLEGQMFAKVHFEMFDDDEEDVWNQWAADINLDDLLRKIAREEFKVSQVYVGMWWERKIYKVRTSAMTANVQDFKAQIAAKNAEQAKAAAAAAGLPAPPEPPDLNGPGRGNRTRKKSFAVEMPTSFTVFDPTKVLPVGNMMFGRQRYAYIANPSEADAFDQALAGNIADSTVLQLIDKRYSPTGADIQACSDIGVDYRNLFLFREGAVFRHTLTRADYERFAPVRLRSILPILEMKDHLRNSDRASLIGNTNFIVVIRKGTDRLPAKPVELEHLREQSRMIARLPVLVGDHRLNVEIVAPPIDHTLSDSRWQVLDARLVFKALQTFSPLSQAGGGGGGGRGSGSSGVSENSRLISRGLENRRHMIMRTLEKEVFQAIMDKNDGTLTEFPDLSFSPRRISLSFETDVVNAILKLRDRGDISRETTLEELDYDQDTEVTRRAKERIEYDEIFQSGTPFSSPQMNPFQANQPGGQPGQPPAPAPAKPAAKPPTSGSTPQGGRPAGVSESSPRTPKGTPKA